MFLPTPVQAQAGCPETVRVNVQEKDPNLAVARKGCIRYYGPGACLIRIVQKSENNYHAICRRKSK